MKKMNNYEAPKAEVIEMVMPVVLVESSTGDAGNDGIINVYATLPASASMKSKFKSKDSKTATPASVTSFPMPSPSILAILIMIA